MIEQRRAYNHREQGSGIFAISSKSRLIVSQAYSPYELSIIGYIEYLS